MTANKGKLLVLPVVAVCL